MSLCRDCKHFTEYAPYAPRGDCSRWKTGYSKDPKELPLNEVLVENDEGWAMIVGPEFGCGLHEAK